MSLLLFFFFLVCLSLAVRIESARPCDNKLMFFSEVSAFYRELLSLFHTRGIALFFSIFALDVASHHSPVPMWSSIKMSRIQKEMTESFENLAGFPHWVNKRRKTEDDQVREALL